MNSEKQLELELVNKLTSFQSVPTDLAVVEANLPDSGVPRSPVDINLVLKVKGEFKRAAMIVTQTESSAILRDKMRQIKEYAREFNVLPFVGGRYFGDGDRNLAMVEGVNLVDLAGNMYLRTKTLHYERIIPNNPFAKKLLLKDVFAPVSSRVVRVLLVNRDRKWLLYEIAKQAQVSMGLTHRIIVKLMAEKVVERDKNNKLVLIDPTRLLDDWQRTYNSQTLQKFSYYSYKGDQRAILNEVRSIADNGNFKYALSFFTGAQFIAPFIRGKSKVEFYIDNPVDLPTWERLLDMQKVESGSNVDIYIPHDAGAFYGLQQKSLEGEEGTFPVVSTVQLYVDLYNNPARGREQAEHLRSFVLKY